MIKKIANSFKAYFSLGKYEAIAYFIVFFISMVFSLAVIFWPPKKIILHPPSEDLAELIYTSDSIQSSFQSVKRDGRSIHPFVFNPNELDSLGWLKLGLSPRQVKSIMNYRNKGGQFRDKNDVKKMYAISAEEYLKLESYINIPKKEYHYTKKEYKKINININTADTAEWNKLYGIGPVLAYRIVNYRNRFSGFISKDQLLDVIPDSTYHKIKDQLTVHPNQIKGIAINEITFQDLSKHPYFGESNALKVIKIRKANGRIDQWNQIDSLQTITDSTKKLIKPYLRYK
jgi:DNA uptake protein ComE-like DNA-binding protein